MRVVIGLVTCKSCNTTHKIEMTEDQLNRLEEGIEHIQGIFPDKTPDERELLISRTCGTCWDKLFANETQEAHE